VHSHLSFHILATVPWVSFRVTGTGCLLKVVFINYLFQAIYSVWRHFSDEEHRGLFF
jgi:hypothetical protein